MTTLKGLNFKIKELIDVLNSPKRRKNRIFFIVEKADWVINYVGFKLTTCLRKLENAEIATAYSDSFLRNKIIHYGSINTFVNKNKIKLPHKSNKIVITWFHLIPNDPRINFISKITNNINILHTASRRVAEEFMSFGFPKHKIVVVPLGVDLSVFYPCSKEERKKNRQDLNIPENCICIGSFQKDGVGWGKGLEPKLIKGPDIFCEVVKKLKEKYNILVLLAGPARGYVKERIKKSKIPFIHKYCRDIKELGRLYRALDLYIVSSRIEGGPLSLIESMASGVPVISTKVGMAPEIIREGENGMLCDVEDEDGIVNKASKVIEDKQLAKKIIFNGIETAGQFSWEKIAAQYYERIYRKLLN